MSENTKNLRCPEEQVSLPGSTRGSGEFRFDYVRRTKFLRFRRVRFPDEVVFDDSIKEADGGLHLHLHLRLPLHLHLHLLLHLHLPLHLHLHLHLHRRHHPGHAPSSLPRPGRQQAQHGRDDGSTPGVG